MMIRGRRASFNGVFMITGAVLVQLVVVPGACAFLADQRTSQHIGTPKWYPDMPPIHYKSSRQRVVALQTSTDPIQSRNQKPRTNNTRQPIPTIRQGNGDSASAKKRRIRMTKSPEQVERELVHALDALQRTWSVALAAKHRSSSEHGSAAVTSSSAKTDVMHMLLFPSTRECNAALAAFGDAGELLRALRLFGRMRKAVSLQQHLLRLNTAKSSSTSSFASWPVPTPTLVTYSTLMSRAVKLSKPQVALRLWDLMMKQQSPHSENNNNDVMMIDLKAANIRMNCFAKLADADRARNLLEQLKTGCGPDVPALTPNLVTYNTLIDACHRAGDLDAALEAASDMMMMTLTTTTAASTTNQTLTQNSNNRLLIQPDARTYTSLIATVARRPSKAAGRNDPTLAFSLLQEMQNRGIRPNGMTYSALIDVCGRCRRSDLALQGLRIMLQQRAQEQKELNLQAGDGYVLPNEVGAWTAAINACGKAGRLKAAMRLFQSMQNFGVMPNTVTCGSLTDSLLRAGRTAETLEVLRFMKTNGIQPSEVMYTSLMTRAESLVQMENKRQYQQQTRDPRDGMGLDSDNAKAIEVYTELIKSLTGGRKMQKGGSGGQGRVWQNPQKDHNTLIMKVFLVFQEMKTAGAAPDLACFNALLRACARAGDFEHAQSVLRQMHDADLDPNDTSWRQLIQTAAEMKRSDLAEAAWKQGLLYRRSRAMADEPQLPWTPSEASVAALATAYLREAESAEREDQERIYQRVVDLYEDLLMGDEVMGFDRVDLNEVLGSQRTMLLILQGIVEVHRLTDCTFMMEKLRKMALSILELESCKDFRSSRLTWTAKQAVKKARSWQERFK